MSLCQGYFAKSRWASHPESRSGKKGIRIFHRPLKNPFNKVRYNDKDAPLAISGAFCTKGRGMYMSGQIKADVYMKFRLHLRWGIYMRSSVNDQFNGNRSPWLGIGHPVPVIFNGKTLAQ